MFQLIDLGISWFARNKTILPPAHPLVPCRNPRQSQQTINYGGAGKEKQPVSLGTRWTYSVTLPTGHSFPREPGGLPRNRL